MEKKFALVTEYGEINEDRNVKAVRNGTMSIYGHLISRTAHATAVLTSSSLTHLTMPRRSLQSSGQLPL